VGVLKSKRDQQILLRQHWYRIPVVYLPKREFKYVAFYQPLIFGKHGKRIEYYARVSKKKVLKRIDLLPDEPNHSRSGHDYLRIEFKEIVKLDRPIKNIIPRRIVFGFTTLKALLSSKDILQLYGVMPTEQIVQRALKHFGIQPITEHTVSTQGRRYRIDLALIRANGRIAIECDNFKAHSGKIQIQKDRAKDRFLRSIGWRVIRLTEKDIIENLHSCVARVIKTVKTLDNQ